MGVSFPQPAFESSPGAVAPVVPAPRPVISEDWLFGSACSFSFFRSAYSLEPICWVGW